MILIRATDFVKMRRLRSGTDVAVCGLYWKREELRKRNACFKYPTIGTTNLIHSLRSPRIFVNWTKSEVRCGWVVSG